MVFVTSIVIEKPVAPVGITLDVSKRNGINISPAGLFGPFVPKRLFRTEDEAFHGVGDAVESRERFLGQTGDSGSNGCSRTPSGGEIK